MYAQEVDFGAFESIGSYAKRNRYTGYEGDEFAGLAGPDTYMPLFAPAWRLEGPIYVSRALS